MILIAAISTDAIFGAVITVGVALAALIAAIWRQSAMNAQSLTDIKDFNIPELKVRMDILWDKHNKTWEFLRDRGEAEVLQKGFGKKDSPVSIDGMPNEMEIIKIYEPFLPALERINEEVQGDLECDPDDPRLFEAIGQQIGHELALKVCPVLQVNQGGCVTLAIAVLRKKKKQKCA